MAEKQYKNYDERFLKEDSSSGSRPVISYTDSDPDEVLTKGSNIFFKAKFEDGQYCQTSEDLINLFQSGFIFAFESPGDYVLYSNQMVLMIPNGAVAAITVCVDLTTSPLSYACMVTAPAFEQLKQSVS